MGQYIRGGSSRRRPRRVGLHAVLLQLEKINGRNVRADRRTRVRRKS